ncbi:MAG: hypothetical protein M3460_23075 [Actinomycetota bacterium]|nr:hypothetical protein [Actinomycetota bacterium]
MIIKVTCRIAGGPGRPGELEVAQAAAPLVSWSVNTRDASEAWELLGSDLAIELRFPDNTVWTGEAYLADAEPDHQVPGQPCEQEFPLKVQLRGTGPLRENSIPLHADVVNQRIRAMSAGCQY